MKAGPPLRLTFDAARCDGWGMCTVVFPEGISLDPWGFAHVTGEAVTDGRLQRRALRAVACCPRQALAVSRDARDAREARGARDAGQPAPPTASGRHRPQ